MPCRDAYDDLPGINASLQEELAVIGPALCAVFRALASEKGMLMEGLLNQIDWKEAGVTKKEVLDWWKKHEAEDERRRAREVKEAMRKKLREEALAKLTPEERKVLGIK